MNRLLIRGTVKIMFFFVVLAATVEAQATVRRVPADHPTIQQAITASVNGDTVLVAPGTYVENIDFVGKAITVTSEAGPQVTIIDGNQAGSVVTFRTGEGRDSVISGFTIQNGLATFDFRYTGGGINLWHSSPTIRNNILKDNIAYATGGAIGMEYSSPLIQGNIITSNHTVFSGRVGGGIMVSFSSNVEILGNRISDHSADSGGGLFVYVSDSVTIRNNTFENNSAGAGGGIYLAGGYPTFSVIQNVFKNNTASVGGGIFWQVNGGQLVNNTIVDNSASLGSGIYAYAFNGQSLWSNNIIQARLNQNAVAFGPGNLECPAVNKNNIYSPGILGLPVFGPCSNETTSTGGNIFTNPLFVNSAAGDYHLSPGSPSIDTGDNTAPNLPATDLDGNPRLQDGNGDGLVVVDMGTYEAPSPAPPFNICIRDDSNGSTLKFNSTTGDYQYTNCSGLTLSGRGTLTQRGGTITLQHYAADRRVSATIDTTVNRATASIQLFSQGTTFTIIDRNTSNNTCACPGR